MITHLFSPDPSGGSGLRDFSSLSDDLRPMFRLFSTARCIALLKTPTQKTRRRCPQKAKTQKHTQM